MGKNKEISNGLKMLKYRMVKKEEISNGFEKLTILGKNVPIPNYRSLDSTSASVNLIVNW